MKKMMMMTLIGKLNCQAHPSIRPITFIWIHELILSVFVFKDQPIDGRRGSAKFVHIMSEAFL